MKKDYFIPSNADFTIHERLDLLEDKLKTYKNREDIFQFVYDDLLIDLYEIRNLLYLNRVASAIPVYKAFEVLADHYHYEDDFLTLDLSDLKT